MPTAQPSPALRIWIPFKAAVVGEVTDRQWLAGADAGVHVWFDNLRSR
jgi:hypothetical protein